MFPDIITFPSQYSIFSKLKKSTIFGIYCDTIHSSRAYFLNIST